MTPTRPPAPDFNPSTRDPSSFGYSPVRDAINSLARFLHLAPLLAYLRAVDSSHWTIANVKDWKQVAASIALFYTKSTEGISYQDIDSQLGALEARTAGLITLFFHFFRRNLPGNQQFTYFQSKTESLINQIGGKHVVIIDMETADNVSNVSGNNNFKLFANAAHVAGYKVGLYINPASWTAFGLGAWVNEYVDFYILAAWKPGNSPGLPAGMDAAKLAMQQEGVLGLHSWIEPIPGVTPQMDCNLLLWTLAQWETLTGQKYSPGAPPAPVPPLTTDHIIEFKTKTTMNIRETANVSSKIVGNLPTGTIVAALAITPTTAASVWVKIGEEQHIALVHAGVVYLDPA